MKQSPINLYIYIRFFETVSFEYLLHRILYSMFDHSTVIIVKSVALNALTGGTDSTSSSDPKSCPNNGKMSSMLLSLGVRMIDN